MIVLDTSILSTFARVNSIDLLFRLFANKELGVVPAIYAELAVGVREGYSFLQTAVDLIESSKLRLLILTPEEVLQRVH